MEPVSHNVERVLRKALECGFELSEQYDAGELPPDCYDAESQKSAMNIVRMFLDCNNFDHRIKQAKLKFYTVTLENRRLRVYVFRKIPGIDRRKIRKDDSTIILPEFVSRPIKRRSRLRREGSVVSMKERLEIFQRDNFTCQLCGIVGARAGGVEIPLHVDHIIPRSMGGSNNHSNLRTLCFLCNTRKNDRLLLRDIQEIIRRREDKHG